METLHDKPVIVVTPDGEPVSIGRFFVVRDSMLNQAQRVELEFSTETMSCRLRIPPAKVDVIKSTWDGAAYRYVLPPGNSVWRPEAEDRSSSSAKPIVETYPIPPFSKTPIIPPGGPA